MPRRVPTDDERRIAWDKWLDGDTVGTIHRYDLDELSVASIRQILADDPPDSIRSDIRYQLGARFFWVSASGLVNGSTGKSDAFVVVQSPRRYDAAAFRSALRAVRRHVRAAGGEADLTVLEHIEPVTAVGFVNDR